MPSAKRPEGRARAARGRPGNVWQVFTHAPRAVAHASQLNFKFKIERYENARNYLQVTFILLIFVQPYRAIIYNCNLLFHRILNCTDLHFYFLPNDSFLPNEFCLFVILPYKLCTNVRKTYCLILVSRCTVHFYLPLSSNCGLNCRFMGICLILFNY